MAKPPIGLLVFISFLSAVPGPVLAQEPVHLVHHDMKVYLDPNNHMIQVEDHITIPDSLLHRTQESIQFFLHEGLNPSSETMGVQLTRLKNSHSENSTTLENYSLTFPAERNSFTLKYEGKIDFSLNKAPGGDPRDASESPGFINREGIQLAGATYWYPWFTDDFITFRLEVQTPKLWQVISQGERTQHRTENRWVYTVWESPEPQDEILLIGGMFIEYSKMREGILAQAYLRKTDKNIAKNYLKATFLYLEMYSRLIGPYPYKKFAMIENFLETGYGMPSFTLLGSRVLRLPFILHSSYPHEILHNWWGNGVYVDYEAGNWSEGLTAYLADHLIQEQRGTAVQYRRAALQKYTDYVSDGKDFPLILFRSRHDPITEAIGYGKTMMFFHMLRLQMGDEMFIQGLQEFYRENKFKRATFFDIHRSFSKIYGRELKSEFIQWISATGAPQLRVSGTRSIPVDGGYSVTALLEQTQPGEPYILNIPVAVHMDGEDTAYQATVTMDQKRHDLVLHVPARPLQLDIDPEFDLFRRLHREEIPPALSQTFVSKNPLVILPSDSPKALRAGYRRLAESLNRSRSNPIEIMQDSEINELPSQRTVWILGWRNRFFGKVLSGLKVYDATLTFPNARIGQTKIQRDRHTLVMTLRHPDNPELSLSWIATDNPAAFPGLIRKLPHYGKFSHLVFEGDEPSNILKGHWPILQSPMRIPIGQENQKFPHKGLKPRRALIYPKDITTTE